MAKTKYALTEGEWEIIKVIWNKQPCTAPDVQKLLESRKNWSYSTVKTMMDRMVSKGLLKTERIRNPILYRSVITKQEAQRGEMMKTVKRAFDGAFTPIVQFVLDSDELSLNELNELEELVKQKQSKITQQ
ncbi:MAG: BlaI/MecI/CopY family transcriptional regulator [Planctomycetota bacterium]|jgi:BlaI family penicillinase repressor